MEPYAICYLSLYFLVLGILCVYGMHRFLMTWLYRRHGGDAPPEPRRFEVLPFVTIQLPLYNEPRVVERLLRATCAIDYPRDRFEIQVLDDSTDETSRIVGRLLPEFAAKGITLRHIRRKTRTGFKAGALAQGLEMARGEFLLVFDADFVPPSDILHRMIHHFTDEEVGMVQARWGHLNRSDSLLTRIEAILLDGHFVVEHTARNRSGRFFNFNGTAGIWRRSCIEHAGGWHFDTLTEDLDLSYRAQLAGWRFRYLPDIVVPAELPPTIEAFFSQQYRWTKGAVQTARKLLPAILRSALPPQVKREAVFHLTAHVAYPLLLLLGAMLFPTAVLRSELRSSAVMAVDLVILASTTLSIAAFYLTAEGKERRPWWKTLLLLPLLMAFGIGISVNNSRAVLDALLGGRGEFVRTPKFGPETKKASLAPTSVGVRRAYVELGMLAYLSAGALYLAGRGEWFALPFLLLFLLGFLLVVLHLIPTRWRLAPIILATWRKRRDGKT